MMIHRLMIKTHVKSGLKYLCYTRRNDYESYKGSGLRWKRFLRKHGDEITTEVIFESENRDEFIRVAREKSIEFNVVESSDWANLKIEEGDGGETTRGTFWITNGVSDKCLKTGIDIPDGWSKGRSKCIFKEKGKQSEFSRKSDRLKAGRATSAKWKAGLVKREYTEEHRKSHLRTHAKRVKFEGVEYESVSSMIRTLNITHTIVNKRIKSGEAEYV